MAKRWSGVSLKKVSTSHRGEPHGKVVVFGGKNGKRGGEEGGAGEDSYPNI